MQKRTIKILFGALDLHAFQDNEIIITMTLFKLEIYILSPIQTQLGGVLIVFVT